MRDLEIQTTRISFNPGDDVEGRIVLRCDDEFQCNRLLVRLDGEEQTKVVRGSGENRHVYREKLHHISQEIELLPSSSVPAGEHVHSFVFRIPDDIPGSYEGFHGYIRYEIRAKAEISWAIDPVCQLPIHVRQRIPVLKPEPLQAEIIEDNRPAIAIEIPRDVLRYDDSFTHRFRAVRDCNMRGVRTVLQYIEFVSPRGRDKKTTHTLVENFTGKEELIERWWKDLSFLVQREWPVAFESRLITTWYVLKVVMDVPWMLDQDVIIPLRWSGGSREEAETGDEVEADKEFEALFGDDWFDE
jgi:hypothetical protein